MESILCGHCRRKLAEVAFIGNVTIKCHRCGTITSIQRAASPLPEPPGGPDRDNQS